MRISDWSSDVCSSYLAMIRTARAAGLALVLAAGFLWAPACAEAPAKATVVPPIVYKQRTLDNGLQVLTSLDSSPPNVHVKVWRSEERRVGKERVSRRG